MKNFLSSIFLAISIIFISGFFTITNAQGLGMDKGFIVSYDTTVNVNTDNSIAVVEKIIFDTNSSELHGIYRDINPYSSQNRKMVISDIQVKDENGNPYFFQILSSDSNIRIKIGDPHNTFNGRKTYYIQYRASDAVAQFKELDKIHWNIIGNEWKLPIQEAKATVILPSNATPLQAQCFYGSEGSTNNCLNNNLLSTTTFSFKTPLPLSPHEGLTVAVDFAKGTVIAYPPYKTPLTDLMIDFFKKYLFWPITITLPIFSLIISLFYWHKRGRDSRKTNTVITQYDVIDNLTPLEVSAIVNEKIEESDISAEVIYLATKGYLKIKQLESKHISFRLSERTNFEITLLKDYSDLPNEFDRQLLKSLFQTNSNLNPPSETNFGKGHEIQTIKLSQLQQKFYKDVDLIISLALSSVLSKGYYKNLARMKYGQKSILALIITLFQIVIVLFSISIVESSGHILVLTISILTSIVICSIIYYYSPAKTEKGVTAKEHLLGLKNYLSIAEKDRLEFHSAPERKPEIFERFLPYAMVLNVSRIWAKEFEGVYTTPPSWYTYSSENAFNISTFNQSIFQFQSLSTSYLTSYPSNSSGGGGGGGGGGGTGGGGGGGGGGSW